MVTARLVRCVWAVTMHQAQHRVLSSHRLKARDWKEVPDGKARPVGGLLFRNVGSFGQGLWLFLVNHRTLKSTATAAQAGLRPACLIAWRQPPEPFPVAPPGASRTQSLHRGGLLEGA